MSKNAVALRAFTHGDDSYSKGDFISLPAGQFADWAAVELVREPTEAEASKAKGAAPKSKASDAE